MFSKSLVALFIAPAAAVVLLGMIALLGPGSLQVRTLPVLLFLLPTWVVTICAVFLFPTGLRAALWLGALCVSGFGLICLARHLGWVILPP